MAAVVVTGSGSRLPWHRRWLTGGILRRQLTTAAVLVALVLLLLLTPEVPTTAGTGGGGFTVPAGVTLPKAPGTPGLTVAGVRCAPGVRQVPFSAYSPICVPAWHGNNGGATSPGVTARTITLVYRVAATNELQLLYSLLPPTIVGTNDEAINTMQKYIDVFNRYFELYGRKVVLVPYNGQGNFIDEDTGSGQAAANADALTVATRLHAFADMSLVDSSVMYTTALEHQHVVSFGLYLQDASWYQQNEPWQYTNGPNCTKTAVAIGALFGRDLAHQDAQYAGDPQLRDEQRTIGILYPENQQAAACEQLIHQQLARYGIVPKVEKSIAFDLDKLVSSSQDAMAQLHAAGVTTVICSSCDPISPVFMLQAAHEEGYHPEFLMQSYFAGGTTSLDGFVRNELAKAGTPDEADGILALGNLTGPRDQQEAIRAYAMANGGSTAGILPSYAFAYGPLLYFFDLLQAAGPYLTPDTLRRAMANTAELAPTPSGDLGGWSFGAGQVDPSATYQLLHWDPGTVSPQDGQLGSFDPCFGGRSFEFARNGADVPSGVAPACARLS